MLAGGIIVSKWFVKMEGTMNEQSIALKLDDVEFRRRRRVILTKVNLEVKKGEKWVLFGPNGIGKSTLVQMMSTRGFPSEGTVDILGNRLGKVNVFSYRNRIGLSSAELGRAFPPQEDPLDAIVTALILLSSVLSACVTAFAGPISFVGIAVPHLMNRVTNFFIEKLK